MNKYDPTYSIHRAPPVQVQGLDSVLRDAFLGQSHHRPGDGLLSILPARNYLRRRPAISHSDSLSATKKVSRWRGHQRCFPGGSFACSSAHTPYTCCLVLSAGHADHQSLDVDPAVPGVLLEPFVHGRARRPAGAEGCSTQNHTPWPMWAHRSPPARTVSARLAQSLTPIPLPLQPTDTLRLCLFLACSTPAITTSSGLSCQR